MLAVGSSYMAILAHLSCCNQILNATDWVAYKQLNFIFHCSRDWEAQNYGASRFSVVAGEDPLPGS